MHDQKECFMFLGQPVFIIAARSKKHPRGHDNFRASANCLSILPPSILSANDKYARVSVVRPLTRRFKIIHLHCINSTSYNSSIIFLTPIFSFNTNQIFHVTRLLLPLDFHSLVLNWFKAY